MGRAHLRHGAVKTTTGVFRHPLGVVDMALVFGELLEHRQLVGFLKTTQAHSHGASLWRDHDHGAVGPISRRNRGYAIANAGSVLTNHHAVATTHAGIAIGHVRSTLLVHHGYQPDTGRRKNIHRIHKGRAHDAKNIGHAIGDHGFYKRLGRRHFLDSARDGAGIFGGFAHRRLLVSSVLKHFVPITGIGSNYSHEISLMQGKFHFLK